MNAAKLPNPKPHGQSELGHALSMSGLGTGHAPCLPWGCIGAGPCPFSLQGCIGAGAESYPLAPQEAGLLPHTPPCSWMVPTAPTLGSGVGALARYDLDGQCPVYLGTRLSTTALEDKRPWSIPSPTKSMGMEVMIWKTNNTY